MRESAIEKQFCEAAKAEGWLARKFTSPGCRYVPDRILLMPGARCVFVEFKSPGGKLSVGQQREHDRLRVLDFAVWVIDSKEAFDVFINFYRGPRANNRL